MNSRLQPLYSWFTAVMYKESGLFEDARRAAGWQRVRSYALSMNMLLILLQLSNGLQDAEWPRSGLGRFSDGNQLDLSKVLGRNPMKRFRPLNL